MNIRIIFLILCFGSAASHALAAEKNTTPIAIDADQLEILQQKNIAIFRGHVEAKQGAMRVLSDKMTVHYKPKTAQTQDNVAQASNSMSGLDKIIVEGKVQFFSNQESATADRGIYEAQKEKLFLFGNVILRRGEHVLNGSQLEYNLASGTSLLSGGVQSSGINAQTSGGRVRAIFTPSK
ncbi:MAG: lipopolysaccharide transport periplasmic protein LptA [Alphaproteobacteria bacterium]|nr:MAG: lipopolysaccharide transport periplasmic protein LptA [Alphaproteobacteria bacterium]TAF15915.1 MAG: lipopolysaccharide transport periplasmic protein LptA [Alphaproteobacteria bacterium]TAF39933.1 MAG: lipopolysaccharide transport periplasmic protein LptA [Alphaproteobacteria bacterium]TAF76729.1 MAG: lipopolysaccharide transport periplasmic protein LptA [Alphaproteobacteria bacterium]